MLGAGVRAPLVLHGLVARQDELELTEVVLHDLDPDRLAAMTALGRFLCGGWDGRFELRSDDDPRAALADARFVFAAIRPGQERARTFDEELPLKHGVLGQETTGAGGFAMAMRTIPAMLEHARTIGEVAPEALVVNFTNPVGIVTQALHDHSSVRVVGVCDGPVSMKRSIASFLGVPGDAVHADYAGLNHCGWIHRVRVDGEDRLPELLDRFDELRKLDDRWALFDTELVQTLGMLPMEYLYFFYYRDRAVQNIVDSGGTRAAQIATINDQLWPELRARVAAGDPAGAANAWTRAMETRDETYFARERGEALPAPAPRDGEPELFEGEGYEGVATAVMLTAARRMRVPLILDVANRGAIGCLRDDDVVEVTSMMDQHGAHPLAQGRLPESAESLLRQVKLYERLTVEAATTGSYDTALRALLTHPLVGSYPLARSILDDYLSAHAEYLSLA
jgi:alpha-galactosidase/6-phospho-beta-glucosidase family protein